MPFLKDKSKLQSNSKKFINITNKNGLRNSVYNIWNDKYVGNWKHNNKEGKGACLTRTYSLYEGDWENNFRHGFGVVCCRTENKTFILKYRGNWNKGLESGFGARHYKNGSYYIGHLKNSKRHGYGQMWYADGSYYDGDWNRDVRHGLGMLVRLDGNRYEGAWASNLKHGDGRFFHLHTGQMQEGVWNTDICVYSIVVDIPFRQTALLATQYPIQIIMLENPEKVCSTAEKKVLTRYHHSSCFQETNTEALAKMGTAVISEYT